jgi:putative oxidoreductase
MWLLTLLLIWIVKIGMPWSPIDSNLGLFEVAFGSQKMLQDMAESLLLLLHFAWMGAFAEAIGLLY